MKTILDFFIQKFHKHKKHETLTANKNKKCAYKYLRGKKSFAYLRFCTFARLRLCAFGAFGAFGACKIFS